MTPYNYPNPLDNFRSYSYHFTMVVANTTEAYRKLLTPIPGNNMTPFASKALTAQLGEKLDGVDAYLILDTKRFAHYTVDNFECQHMFGTGKIENPTVPSVTSLMKITDTTGLTFFNFLMDIMKNKLQSTRASAFFLLSIQFIGHHHDGRTEVIDNCFMTLFLINLGFKFTSAGSIFDLEFVETFGNPGERIPSIMDLGGAMTISTEKRPDTVGGMIQALEDFLNVSSLQFFNKYNNKALEKEGQKNQFTQVGKLVQYMITIPEEWKNFTIDTAEKSKHIEQRFIARRKDLEKQADEKGKELAAAGKSEEEVAKARASYLSFSDALSIQDAFNMILESSKEYLDLGSQDRRILGEAVVHKTVSGVTSDNNTYVIHFDIYPMRAPKLEVEDAQSRRMRSANTDVVKTSHGKSYALPDGTPRNLITYDYLFTGRNSHILDLEVQFSPTSIIGLDLDLEIGDKRFATVSDAAGAKKEMDKRSASVVDSTEDFNPNMRSQDPLFFPLKMKEEKTNHGELRTEEYSEEKSRAIHRAKREYSTTMAFLHFVGSMQTQLTIRGNPNLIRKYADVVYRGGVPIHPSSIIKTSDLKTLSATPMSDVDRYFKNNMSQQMLSEKERYFAQFVKPRHDDVIRKSANDSLMDGSDITVAPVFVKINIKAPNFDLAGNVIDGEMYSQKFFYQGYYMILNMTTVFESGSFKHVLSLSPVDYDGSFSNATTTSTNEAPKQSQPAPVQAQRSTPRNVGDGTDGVLVIPNGFSA